MASNPHQRAGKARGYEQPAQVSGVILLQPVESESRDRNVRPSMPRTSWILGQDTQLMNTAGVHYAICHVVLHVDGCPIVRAGVGPPLPRNIREMTDSDHAIGF